MYNNKLKKETLENILNFINENKETYIHFLSQMRGFPSVCDYSSFILGAYLGVKFGIKPVYIEGDFEVEENPHCWIYFDKTIVDFTAYQFTSVCFSKKEIKKMTPNELFVEYVVKTNTPIILTKEDEKYEEYLFIGEYNISDEYIEYANQSESFQKFLKLIKQSKKELFK